MGDRSGRRGGRGSCGWDIIYEKIKNNNKCLDDSCSWRHAMMTELVTVDSRTVPGLH